MKTKPLLIVLAVFAFLIGLFFLGSYLVKNENQNLKNTDLIHSPNSFRKGSEKALVVVTEFFDPECESCREFQPYLNSLLNDYDGRIQLVLRYAPFHPNSIFAVKILEAAREQNQYWETLQVLYKFQPDWGSHDHPRPELIWGYLNSLNLDINKLKVDMESERIKNLIDDDIKAGKSLGVYATPTFFVNGKMVSEFGPVYLRTAIEEALKQSSN